MPSVITDDEYDALAAWQLGPLLSAVVPEMGSVNRTIIVHTADGAFALRVSSRERIRVEWEQTCIEFAAQYGIPVCKPIPLPAGGTILERKGFFLALFPLADGVQIERHLLGDKHALAAGECLARLHAAFQAFPAEHARAKNMTLDSAAVLASIPRIESAVRAQASLTAVDRAALEQLSARRDWLERNGGLAEDIPARLAALPHCVVHGDYQETNLFFEDDIVSAVIDWDQSGLTARGWEIVRSLHLMLTLAPNLSRAFLAGYRRILPVPLEELQEAAACYGVLADSNLWVYEAAYLEDNARAKRFIAPGLFVPFSVQWAAAGVQ